MIKKIIKNNKYLYFAANLLKDLPGILAYSPRYAQNKKPVILQLPITYKCNFDCVMCGMREVMSTHNDFTPDELEKILKNRLFTDIKLVGINGGEPFIKKDLADYVDILVKTLPKLKIIHIISNGYFTENITKILPVIKEKCRRRDISLTLQLSVDAVNELQDFVRGKENSFSCIEETCNALLKNQKIYYDNISFVCTITKHNVYNLYEVEHWANKKGIPVNYSIATYHERVYNKNKFEDFTILNDELAGRMAAEFFFMKFTETKSQKYFALYYFILRNKRISQCDYRYNTGVTLTPNKQLSYCAKYSKELGDAFISSAEDLFFGNLEYRRKLCIEKCDTCSHYMNLLNREGFFLYIKQLLSGRKIFH